MLPSEREMDGGTPENETLFPTRAGDRLREARLAQKLDLAEVAARTRIPQRHLEAIEQSNYASLPSPTYALGFAKAYARAVDADEVAIAAALRQELATNYERAAPREMYSTEDPDRVSPSGVAWAGVAIALLLLVGVAIWYSTDWFRGGETAPAPSPITSAEPSPMPTLAATPASGGHVALIATDQVWVRIYDAMGKSLFEKTLARGERYDVPDDANGPMINVGRPEMIQVTVNGSNVAPLGAPGVAVKDVGISAAALQARGQPKPAATSPTTPVAAATSAPRRPAATPAPATRRAAPAARPSGQPAQLLPPAFRNAAPSAEPVQPPGNVTGTP